MLKVRGVNVNFATIILVFALALFGCSSPGDQTRDETDVSLQGTEKVKATQDTEVKTTKPTPFIEGGLTMEKGAKLDIRYEGKPPQETVETKTEKLTESSSFMDYTLRDVHEKLSGLYWIMVLVACAGFWLLFRSIVNSKEFAVARGGMAVVHGLLSHVASELKASQPGHMDHTALTKVEGMLQERAKELQGRMHPKKPFHG